MFTGIIEGLAEVIDIKKEGNNLLVSLKATFTNELRVDQECVTQWGVFNSCKHRK